MTVPISHFSSLPITLPRHTNKGSKWDNIHHHLFPSQKGVPQELAGPQSDRVGHIEFFENLLNFVETGLVVGKGVEGYCRGRRRVQKFGGIHKPIRLAGQVACVPGVHNLCELVTAVFYSRLPGMLGFYPKKT